MSICKFENCKTRASYNVDGQSKALYCGVHKKEIELVVHTLFHCIPGVWNADIVYHKDTVLRHVN
jgi:hypothetical protein